MKEFLMDFQQIIEIHQKEKELKQELQKINEKKKMEFNSLDEYQNKKQEDLKKRLSEFTEKTEKMMKEKIDTEINKIENETKNLIKNYDVIDKKLLDKAIEYVKEEFFKD